jgi:predicted DNA binding CopG/RHH family protein
MANLKEAMKKAKDTRKPQSVEAAAGSKESSEVKVNISIRLDLEVLKWLKAQAELKGLPYQTFTNSVLHSAMRENSTLEKRVEAIEKKLKGRTG